MIFVCAFHSVSVLFLLSMGSNNTSTFDYNMTTFNLRVSCVEGLNNIALVFWDINVENSLSNQQNYICHVALCMGLYDNPFSLVVNKER